MYVVELGYILFDVFSGIVLATIWPQGSGINAHIIQLSVRIGDDLEYKAAKRILEIGLSALFLVRLFRIPSNDRRSVQRTGQVADDRVQQWLDANVFAPAATENGLNETSNSLFP